MPKATLPLPTSTTRAHHRCVEITPNRDAHAATEGIRVLAEAQHGVIARRQLLELGLSEGLIRGRVIAGSLIPVYEGVFALGHRLIGERGRWMAAVLATGPRSVLSHASAAALWGIRAGHGPPEVTRTSGGTTRSGVLLHQTKVLEPAEVGLEDGIPITSLERTLLDVSARLDERRLERAVVTADRTGGLRWSELGRLLDRTPRRPGAGKLRRVAKRVSPYAVEARSPLEVDFLALCRDAALPEPQVNVLAAGYVVDFLWPAQRIVVETDGYAYHADRLAFERDHERTVALTAAGYEVHRVTYAMLKRDPASFVALVRRSLDTPRGSRFRVISTQS